VVPVAPLRDGDAFVYVRIAWDWPGAVASASVKLLEMGMVGIAQRRMTGRPHVAHLKGPKKLF
jgi:hypothetical protein